MTLVIFQDRVRLRCQRVTIMSVWIKIYRDHVRPLIEVLLTFGRKFVLIILRPAMQITDASNNESRLRCCSGRRVACNFYCSGRVRLLCTDWDARES
jgi:hypothetical protein